jgi:hypothetical protein
MALITAKPLVTSVREAAVVSTPAFTAVSAAKADSLAVKPAVSTVELDSVELSRIAVSSAPAVDNFVKANLPEVSVPKAAARAVLVPLAPPPAAPATSRIRLVLAPSEKTYADPVDSKALEPKVKDVAFSEARGQSIMDAPTPHSSDSLKSYTPPLLPFSTNPVALLTVR